MLKEKEIVEINGASKTEQIFCYDFLPKLKLKGLSNIQSKRTC